MAVTRIYEQRRVKWIRWPQGKGGPIVPSVPPPFQLIAKGDMWVRDFGSFLAGEPHKHMSGWEYLTQNHPQQDLTMSWIKDGINIHEFIVPFHGTYRRYHHSFPPDAIFPNDKSCIPHAQVISTEIEKKIAMGAMTALGRVEEVPSPRIVMSLSIKPSKPRLVHDQQYLNCFMKHYPFKLDQVVNIPRYTS